MNSKNDSPQQLLPPLAIPVARKGGLATHRHRYTSASLHIGAPTLQHIGAPTLARAIKAMQASQVTQQKTAPYTMLAMLAMLAMRKLKK